MKNLKNTSQPFRHTSIALASILALSPTISFSLDLATSPPGTTEPYVAPNVIISIDDSGSMDYKITSSSTGDSKITTPKTDGTWDTNAKRINILIYALNQVFGDTSLVGDKKIRLAWQAMFNNGKSPGVGSDNKITFPGYSGSYTSNSGANNVDSSSIGENSMKVLDSTHRANFKKFVDKLSANNGTPSHLMFSQADNYMRRSLSINSPWASIPGQQGAPYLGCRRNYHIMMTDGRWNGVPTGGTQDNNNVNKTLPDGMVFGSTSSTNRPYNNIYSDSFSNTLADWAFYSWSTPLQLSGLTGSVQPNSDYRKAPAQENFGKDTQKKDAILDRYWNPRYDPATWPHMVTYTIGFSTDATTWPGASTIIGPTSQVPFGYDNSFLDLITGNKKWPDMSTGENVRALDLWHAALNGRGRFYAVMKGEDLEKAFREIIGQINNSTDPDLTSTATSGSNNSRYDVGRFTGAYEPQKNWKGFVTAETVQTDGTTVPTSGWSGQTTADKLDARAASDRVILSWSDKWSTTKYRGGVAFRWASDESILSSTQKTMLQIKTDGTTTDQGATVGQQRLNYIRGDRSLEGSDSNGYTTDKPYRERKSKQGDIINSVIWYTGAPSSNYSLKGYSKFTLDNKSRQSIIYVGGNDGMLHGFSATDGSELLAYIPRGSISTLNLLTDPQYNNKHKYFVDGSPMTGDIDLGAGIQDPSDPSYNTNYASDWHTMLVGTLGAGGKGYFVLDVTDPSIFKESNAQSIVKIDRSRASTGDTPNCSTLTTNSAEQNACLKAVAEDKDIGHITARPVLDDDNPMRTTQITRMNNNRWAVVLGNGYNSTNQRPVLLVQYLDKDKELLSIPVTTDTATTAGTTLAKDNGLSSPRLVDINGDGRPDIAYAGDNLGNMWKFDLTNIDDSRWAVAFNGTPLFSATGPSALNSSSRPNSQPITVAPTVRANDRMKNIGTTSSPQNVAVGGMMVAFGTGRNVSQTDPNSVQVQSLYSVLDNTRYRLVSTTIGSRIEVHPGNGTCATGSANCIPTPKALGTGVTSAALAEQKITELGDGSFGTVDSRTESSVLDSSTWKNFNGWFLDLPAVGERSLKPFEFYDGTNILAIYTQVPAKGSNVDVNVESCESTSVDEERQYRTLINIMDGARPTVQVVDKNGDGLYDASDLGVSRVKVSKGSHTLITQKNRVNDIDTKNNKEALARMPEQSLRPSWRQLH